MTKITEKQLIESLKQLKQIKPRKEWALLVKSQILSDKQAITEAIEKPGKLVGIMDTLKSVFFQRKLAYALATFVFLIAGLFGFAGYTMPGDLLFPVKKIAEQSQAALTGQMGLIQDVAVLNSRINDLAQVSKNGRKENITSAISEINANALALTKNLKNSSVKNSETIKEIAVSLKTLASVPGEDLAEGSDVKGLYEVVVQSQIDDLEKTTLTEDQKEALIEIKSLYDEGKYADALEQILLINK